MTFGSLALSASNHVSNLQCDMHYILFLFVYYIFICNWFKVDLLLDGVSNCGLKHNVKHMSRHRTEQKGSLDASTLNDARKTFNLMEISFRRRIAMQRSKNLTFQTFIYLSPFS